MNGCLLAIALLIALPQGTLQGWSKNSVTPRAPPPPGEVTTTTWPPPPPTPPRTPTCSQYTTDTTLFHAGTCGRWNLPRASTSSSWFRWFLDVFLLQRRGSEVEDVGMDPDPLIIAGSPATITEAPWLVFISYTMSGTSHICTGSIIDELHVMTAGHCIKEGNAIASSMNVTFGNENYRLGTTYPAVSWLPHPSWSGNISSPEHDIAVVKLSRALTFSSSVQPICIPKSDSFEDARTCPMNMLGWGITFPINLFPPNILQKLNATVNAKEQCMKEYNMGIICVSGPSGISGICQGDSGGPLAVYVNGIAYAMGVASYTESICGFLPGRYTRVSANVDFIYNAVLNG